MSHLVPHYMLLEAGVESRGSTGHTHLNNHYNVALSVLAGDYDAGAVKDEVFKKYSARGLRVLVWTPEISEHLFITSGSLPQKTRDALRDALYWLRDTEEGRDILKGIKSTLTALVPAAEGDYDNLANILTTLRMKGVIK